MVLAMAATALGTGAAVAATPPDPAKVPHYFGPWPNWANSPLTLNKASVTFNGTGTGAAAVAQVDPACRRHLGHRHHLTRAGLRRRHDRDDQPAAPRPRPPPPR